MKWTIGHPNGSNCNGIYDVAGNRVAEVYGMPLHTRIDEVAHDDPKWAEGFRTARVIAAAPSVLEAARALLAASIAEYGDPDEWPHDEGVAFNTDQYSCQISFGLLSNLRSAIAAADGKPASAVYEE